MTNTVPNTVRFTAAVLVTAFACAAAPIHAQTRTADPLKRGLQLSDFPRVVKLAENVYGYEEIRQPGFTTVSLIVVGKNGVLVADGQGSAAATQTMVDKIRTLSPLPIKWYVVGSDHGDHTAGNSVLAKDITYIVHRTSRAQLVRDSTAPAPRTVIVPAVAMSADEQSIDLGGTTVRVMFLGRAHTGGDLSVYLPREKILFMSEAYLNRVFPAMRSAYPTEWIATIDRALAVDAQRFVPGHGFIEEPAASREELITFRKALVDVIAEVKRLHGMGLAADDAIKRANWGVYRDWFLAEQQAPVAVRKIYEEIEGKLAAAIPASLQAQGDKKVDVTGKWSFKVESPNGIGTPSITFKQTGDSISGSYTSQVLGVKPFTGTLKDGKIRFSFDAESGGQAFTMMFDGALEGADAMKGSIDYSGMATGAFSGIRQKP